MANQTTEFGEWLRQARKGRGWTMEALATAANITQPYVSGLERGTRNPSREMVQSLVRALTSEAADEHVFQNLLNAGLKVAGFASIESDDHEVIDYFRGLPEPMKDKALRLLRVAFDEEDAKDNAGNIGRRSE